MPLKRLLISAAAVLGLSALGLSANAAAPTASGAGHDQIAGNGKSTFTLIFRGGGFRGGGFRGGGFRGGGFRAAVFVAVVSAVGRLAIVVALAAAMPLQAAVRWGGAGWGVRTLGRRWLGRAGWGGGWGVRRAGWGGGWGGVPVGAAVGACGAPTGVAVGAVPRLGLAARRLGRRLGSSLEWRMGLASRRLGRWRLGLACWRRACRLGLRRRRKLLLELPRGWLWTWLLQRKLILLLRLGLLAPIETYSLQQDDPGCPGAGVFHRRGSRRLRQDDSFLTAGAAQAE